LLGKVTDSPLGMVFPTGGPLPRYPSLQRQIISKR
ncbi:prolipoprotein diacylglyceryl transferase, partial [Francisella tularensis]|nr:prolipoprotein diacylglyceryl transferase [Francisella tularensis]